MIDSRKNIADLYQEHPELYDIFSNDRDFDEQTKSILKYVKSGSSINAIEFFSGPARHSFSLTKQGHSAFSIDSSQAMKNFSVLSGFQEEGKFIVSSLPNISYEFNDTKFDLFLALRYSTGYLDISEIRKLIKWCTVHANQDAVLVIELHNYNKVMGYVRSSKFLTRTFHSTPYGDIRSTWPYEPPVFDSNTKNIVWPVKVEIEKTTHFFESKERIHTPTDIITIVQEFGFDYLLQTGASVDGFEDKSDLMIISF